MVGRDRTASSDRPICLFPMRQVEVGPSFRGTKAGQGGCHFSWLVFEKPPPASKARSLRRVPRLQGKGFALNAVSPIFGREGAACNRVIPLRVSPFHARGLCVVTVRIEARNGGLADRRSKTMSNKPTTPPTSSPSRRKAPTARRSGTRSAPSGRTRTATGSIWLSPRASASPAGSFVPNGRTHPPSDPLTPAGSSGGVLSRLRVRGFYSAARGMCIGFGSNRPA